MKNSNSTEDLVLLVDDSAARALTPAEEKDMHDREKTPEYQQWLKKKEQEAAQLFNLPN